MRTPLGHWTRMKERKKRYINKESIMYWWKCQNCGLIFERLSKGEPKVCPQCRDKGVKTFVKEERRAS